PRRLAPSVTPSALTGGQGAPGATTALTDSSPLAASSTHGAGDSAAAAALTLAAKSRAKSENVLLIRHRLPPLTLPRLRRGSLPLPAGGKRVAVRGPASDFQLHALLHARPGADPLAPALQVLQPGIVGQCLAAGIDRVDREIGG